MITVATSPANRRRTVAQRVLNAVSSESGVTVQHLLSKTRTAKIAHARQDAQFRMWAHGVPEYRIAEFFGADRSTVNHNIHTAARRLIGEK